jgi:hypothetical protein
VFPHQRRLGHTAHDIPPGHRLTATDAAARPGHAEPWRVPPRDPIAARPFDVSARGHYCSGLALTAVEC